jgi:FAD/FMN-containing dehydrogenase
VHLGGVHRRDFLKVGAATGAAVAVGPTLWARAADPVPPSAWSALGAGLDGDLVRPGEAGYPAAHRLFNPMFDGARPAAVVRAQSLADVVESVNFARAHGLVVRPRSGGHSYVGASTGTGVLQLDTTRMDTVTVGSGTVTVQAGARLFDVHQALDGHGRTLPTGSCPTVGVSGLTLGGGVGVEGRAHGLTCDALTEAVVVTADGRVRHASPTSEPNLFWALRGGGGGNVGIVTRFRFRTFPAQPAGFFFLHFRDQDAEAVVRGWLVRLGRMPRSSWANVHVDAVAGGLEVRIVGLSLTGDGRAEAAALEAAIGRDVTQATLFTRDHADAVRLLAGCSTKTDQQCHLTPQGQLPREAFVAGSDVIAASATQLDAGVGAVRRRGRAGGSGSLLLDPLGGRISDVTRGASAFRWRQAKGIAQWYVGLPAAPSDDAVRSARGWIRSGHTAMGAHSVGGYVNYLEHGRPLTDYYGANWTRLRQVKAAYDPTNFFHSPWSVPPA